jgi:hypothetical protein
LLNTPFPLAFDPLSYRSTPTGTIAYWEWGARRYLGKALPSASCARAKTITCGLWTDQMDDYPLRRGGSLPRPSKVMSFLRRSKNFKKIQEGVWKVMQNHIWR